MIVEFRIDRCREHRHLGMDLREGLRANPRSFEILFELGALYAENNRDVPRARAILELSVQRWIEQEARKPEPDTLAYGQILALLADLEERTGNLERSLTHLFRLKQVSPAPERIQKSIDEITAKLKR